MASETYVFEFSFLCVNSSLEELIKIKVLFIKDKECLDSKISKNQSRFQPTYYTTVVNSLFSRVDFDFSVIHT